MTNTKTPRREYLDKLFRKCKNDQQVINVANGEACWQLKRIADELEKFNKKLEEIENEANNKEK